MSTSRIVDTTGHSATNIAVTLCPGGQKSTLTMGVGQLSEFAADAFQLKARALLLVVRKLKSDRSGQLGHSQAQIVLTGAAHLPSPAAILVGVGVRVLDGERRLAHPTDAVHGGDHADVAGLDEVVAQRAQLGYAADKVRVMRVDVAQALLGTLATQDGVGDLAIELLHAL